MTSKTLFTFVATSVLALGLVAVRADDKPGQSQTGRAQPAGDKSASDDAGKGMGKGKMSMAQMMKDCKAHMTACQTHIDAAAKSADANQNDQTKKHLAMAKEEMAACMKMMNMMDKMHGKEGKQAEHGEHQAGAAGEKKAGQ